MITTKNDDAYAGKNDKTAQIGKRLGHFYVGIGYLRLLVFDKFIQSVLQEVRLLYNASIVGNQGNEREHDGRVVVTRQFVQLTHNPSVRFKKRVGNCLTDLVKLGLVFQIPLVADAECLLFNLWKRLRVQFRKLLFFGGVCYFVVQNPVFNKHLRVAYRVSQTNQEIGGWLVNVLNVFVDVFALS